VRGVPFARISAGYNGGGAGGLRTAEKAVAKDDVLVLESNAARDARTSSVGNGLRLR